MAGIYIHIPFCKQACHYCNFHFSTSLNKKKELLDALQAELILQKDYLGTQSIETIYFGGGTPSLMQSTALQALIDLISKHFNLSSKPEITLEANPDDLNPQKIKELRQTAINRFSIGIQSLFDEDLRWMNRVHTADEAENAVKRVQDAGFENITIDLIYGYPLLSEEKWGNTIRRVINFQVPHVSAYAMTVEPATALASFIRKGTQRAWDEAQSAEQFLQLIYHLEETAFDHYEISNFAKPGSYSKHNANYWDGIPYLGIGPSAHSFKDTTRQWNVANNSAYIESIECKKIPAEIETLTTANRVNEYIMTSLRTNRGMSFPKIRNLFGECYVTKIKKKLDQFLSKPWLEINQDVLILTKEGKLFADRIASELFFEES